MVRAALAGQMVVASPAIQAVVAPSPERMVRATLAEQLAFASSAIQPIVAASSEQLVGTAAAPDQVCPRSPRRVRSAGKAVRPFVAQDDVWKFGARHVLDGRHG